MASNDLGRIPLRSGSFGTPVIVNDLPVPVCPYAKIQMLKPSKTLIHNGAICSNTSSWFDSGPTQQEINARSLEESRLRADEYRVEISEWKGFELSRYEQIGGISVLQLNKSHPWVATLLNLLPDYLDNEIFVHVAFLLQAYHKSQDLIDAKNSDAREIAETIEANWGLHSKLSRRRGASIA